MGAQRWWRVVETLEQLKMPLTQPEPHSNFFCVEFGCYETTRAHDRSVLLGNKKFSRNSATGCFSTTEIAGEMVARAFGIWSAECIFTPPPPANNIFGPLPHRELLQPSERKKERKKE